MSYNFDVLEVLGLKGAGTGIHTHDKTAMEAKIQDNTFKRHADYINDLPIVEDIGDGHFTNASSGRNTLLTQMKTQIDNHEELSSLLDEIKADGAGSRLDKMSNKAVDKLNKN